MLDTIYLCHSDLFSEHWVVQRSPWVRNLGWFDRMEAEAWRSNVWFTVGDNGQFSLAKPMQRDIIPIVVDPHASAKLYRWDSTLMKWEHLDGPIVLSAYGHVAGYAGPQDVIEANLAKSANPWEWSGIQVVEVDAIATVKLGADVGAFAVNAGYAQYTNARKVDAPEVVEAAKDGVVIRKIGEDSWVIDLERFSLASIVLEVGFDMVELHRALQATAAEYAWVSDSREWPGWLPADDAELPMAHLFPDAYNQYGAEMFIPVKEIRDLVGSSLNEYPLLKFYDRSI